LVCFPVAAYGCRWARADGRNSCSAISLVHMHSRGSEYDRDLIALRLPNSNDSIPSLDSSCERIFKDSVVGDLPGTTCSELAPCCPETTISYELGIAPTTYCGIPQRPHEEQRRPVVGLLPSVPTFDIGAVPQTQQDGYVYNSTSVVALLRPIAN
jgi:hypothetical protein